MRVINTSVNTLSTRYLVIGFEGENERTQIRIDAASVFDEYPQASPSMAVKPGFGEEVYPVIVTKEGNEVVWDVTQDNLDFTGDGEIQLTFIKDNVICKTTIGKIRVNRSLIVNGDPPEHLDTWYEEATAKLADVDAAVYSLEALDATASGLPAGSSPTVEVQDVNDHKRLAFGIPKGDRGDRGPTGNGIRSISQSGSTGLYKKYTIHYTDGTTTTFQVRDGDRGLKGDTGATPDIGIGTVETLPAGSEATASMSGTAENPRLNLGIPKGDQGIQGEKGDKGDRGATPIFSMGAVTNLPAGSSATATITGTAEEPVLNLGIPKGDKGDKGDRGERGPQGIQGFQGDRGLTGPRGEQGQKGDKGDTGAAGATGATPDLSIGTVSTLPAGSSATAEITGTAENPVLSLGIPQGIQGIQGVQGEKGEKGDPGEGVPTGGITGQVLAKASDTDYDTEWIHVAPVIKNEASGAIASFPDGADGHPVDELKVQIEPVQDLHGYDHPWPAGGGKNKFNTDFSDTTINGTAITKLSDGKVSTSGVPTSAFDLVIGTVTLPAGDYILNGCPAGGGATKYRLQVTDFPVHENLGQDSGSGVSFTLSEEMVVAVRIQVYTGASASLTYAPMIRLASETDATFAPYSNICPITGWDGVKVSRTGKNLLGGSALLQSVVDTGASVTTDMQNLTVSFGSTNIQNKTIARFDYKENTQYTFIVVAENTSALNVLNLKLLYTDGTKADIIRSGTSANTKYTVVVVSNASKTVEGIVGVNQGGTTTLYCAESGIFEGVLTADDFVPYSGTTYSITLPTEAGTVYGGTLDVSTGELVVDRIGVNPTAWLRYNANNGYVAYRINNLPEGKYLEDTYNLPISNIIHVFGSFSSSAMNRNIIQAPRPNSTTAYMALIDTVDPSVTPVQLTYLVKTPITYTLTPTEIRTLLGQNNIWSDAGDVSVKYNADTKLYIDNKITQAIAAALNS